MRTTLLFLIGCSFSSLVWAQRDEHTELQTFELAGNATVEPEYILQFLGSRCHVRHAFSVGFGKFEVMTSLDTLMTMYPGTPFTVYYQEGVATKMYDVGSGELSLDTTIELMASGAYYLLLLGAPSPTLLHLAPGAGKGLLISTYALHLPLPAAAGY